MEPALELTPRQSRRVIESACRIGVDVVLETRTAEGPAELTAALESIEGDVLRLRLADSNDATVVKGVLAGSFCDVRLTLGEQLHWFTCCVLDVLDVAQPARLLVSRPTEVLVANRRSFERATIPTAAQVCVHAAESDRPLMALVADVGPGGLACTFPVASDAELPLIGDPVRVHFELPGTDEAFDLPAVVCNKSLTWDRKFATLGVEFAPVTEAAQLETRRRLQAAVVQLSRTVHPNG